MPIQIRVIGIQHNAVFQQCVEAATHLEREHKHQGWSSEVVRNFEYQFDRERKSLLEKNVKSEENNTASLADSDVIVILKGSSNVVEGSSSSPAFTFGDQEGNGKLLSGEDFVQFVADNSDFRVFPASASDATDPQSYINLARLHHRRFLKSTGCHYAWMLIKQNDVPLGRLVFQLYSEKAPRTCQNFLYLCRGDLPDIKNAAIVNKDTGAEEVVDSVKLSYKDSRVFRVVQNGWIQAGDILPPKLGNGGYSVYGRYFPDETFEIEHDDEGIIGMANDGEHTNASSFYITMQPSKWMNKRYVAFGRVVEGLNVLRALKALKTRHNQSPVDDVVIAECGEVAIDE